MKGSINQAATVISVKNLKKSIDFYTRKLDFELTFTWEDPVDYAVLKNGNVQIHLTKRQDESEPSALHTAILLYVDEVDAVYKDLLEKEVMILNPIGNRDYGLRDFEIRDPDGYIIAFGKSITS